ncbi:hypothetical protein KSS87_017700 [Heliosperma pusillum]|nr:hypothetical protein KSS87_017700 [Heliosperma pusillum]
MNSISLLECNLSALDSLSANSINEIIESWNNFCSITETVLAGNGDVSIGREVHLLCSYGLRSLVEDHFFQSLEVCFESRGASRFWQHFEGYIDTSMVVNKENELGQVLCKALEEISLEKQYQERALSMLIHSFQSYKNRMSDKKNSLDERLYLSSKYQLMVSSVLMASLPHLFPAILHQFFKRKLEELSAFIDGGFQNKEDLNMDIDERCKTNYEVREMDIDEHFQLKKLSENSMLVKNIGKVVQDLRSLGFTSMTEDAYASAIFLLLKDKVEELAGDDYRSSVLDSIKAWIQAVPFQFLQALLTYLGDSLCPDSPASGLKSPLASHPSSLYPGLDTPSESLIRWKLRLEYYAYETLQDLRIAKLFDIIVDYPDSSPAIEDLKQCLDYTGQHSKLVESFISALKYRLLTAGASTNDILHQYVSTIKALRTIDPTGIFLEAVGEPICEYLKGRKDTIKCIVTMLTDGSGGGSANAGSAGDSLLEELNRDEENQDNIDLDDDFNVDDKQAWLSAQRSLKFAAWVVGTSELFVIIVFGRVEEAKRKEDDFFYNDYEGSLARDEKKHVRVRTTVQQKYRNVTFEDREDALEESFDKKLPLLKGIVIPMGKTLEKFEEMVGSLSRRDGGVDPSHW